LTRTLSGLRALLLQRATAVYMLPFILFVLSHCLFDPPDSYQSWRAWITGPVVGVAASVFFAALLMHAWVGVRDVILDYVHPIAIRALALALLGFGLVGVAVGVMQILWQVRV
jgi:succinate dehydrogenase membrane anchor subunit